MIWAMFQLTDTAQQSRVVGLPFTHQFFSNACFPDKHHKHGRFERSQVSIAPPCSSFTQVLKQFVSGFAKRGHFAQNMNFDILHWLWSTFMYLTFSAGLMFVAACILEFYSIVLYVFTIDLFKKLRPKHASSKVEVSVSKSRARAEGSLLHSPNFART